MIPYVVFTLWESRKDFENWVESEEFRKGHAQSGTLPPEAFTQSNKLELHEVFLDSTRPDLEEEPEGGAVQGTLGRMDQLCLTNLSDQERQVKMKDKLTFHQIYS